MDALYIALILIVSMIIGYLFGSISSGILLGKILFKKDPRDYGSHNSGGTNVGRTFGKKIGLICIILDILKTIIPIYIVYFTLTYTGLAEFNVTEYAYLLTSICCLLGHCFPVWYNFKGGKAVSSFAGVIIATSWSLTIVGIILFAVILLLSKKVSLSSIICSFSVALLSLLLIVLPSFFMNFSISSGVLYTLTLIICSLLLIYRHKENIVRLIKHEEREVSFLSKHKTK